MSKSANINLVDLVADRIKASPLGDLITEADLYDIVSQGIDRAFFRDRTENPGSYHSKQLPPLIVATLQAALKSAMQEAVNKWVVQNSDKLADQMKRVFDDGIVKAADEIMAERIRDAQRPALMAIANAMNEERQKVGLPAIAIYF